MATNAVQQEAEEYAVGLASARRTREGVADQLRSLIVEGDRMGGREEVAMRIRHIVEAERRITEAMGRQQQAREEGLPVSGHVEAEREARRALRAAAMSLCVTSAGWVAALDNVHSANGVDGGEDAPVV